tara:strand:- start:13361 stop:13771 length:411 start_codon:yes stop_codon:yes gene_type:complete
MESKNMAEFKIILFKRENSKWSYVMTDESGNPASIIPKHSNGQDLEQFTATLSLTQKEYDNFDFSCVNIDETNKTATFDTDAYSSKYSENTLDTVHQNRRNEYPYIGDQLDALYHAGVFPKEMEDKIKAVKDKYPK